MAPSSKVAKACKAMKDIGISEDTVKPILKDLLDLYEKNWKLIEDEHYRVLIDAIFEREVPKKEETREHESLSEDEVEDCGPPLKRYRLRSQMDTPPAENASLALAEVQTRNTKRTEDGRDEIPVAVRQNRAAKDKEAPISQIVINDAPVPWTPLIARSDRVVTTDDRASSLETANALASALLLPVDVEKHRSYDGERVGRDTVWHMVQATQEVRVLVEKLNAAQVEVTNYAKKNSSFLQTIAGLERDVMMHKQQAAKAFKEYEDMKVVVVAAEHKAKEAEMNFNVATAELEKTRNELKSAKTDFTTAFNAGIDHATDKYEEQLAKMKDMLFEDGWVEALRMAGIPNDSSLYENIPLPSTFAEETEGGLAENASPEDGVAGLSVTADIMPPPSVPTMAEDGAEQGMTEQAEKQSAEQVESGQDA